MHSSYACFLIVQAVLVSIEVIGQRYSSGAACIALQQESSSLLLPSLSHSPCSMRKPKISVCSSLLPLFFKFIYESRKTGMSQMLEICEVQRDTLMQSVKGHKKSSVE